MTRLPAAPAPRTRPQSPLGIELLNEPAHESSQRVPDVPRRLRVKGVFGVEGDKSSHLQEYPTFAALEVAGGISPDSVAPVGRRRRAAACRCSLPPRSHMCVGDLGGGPSGSGGAGLEGDACWP